MCLENVRCNLFDSCIHMRIGPANCFAFQAPKIWSKNILGNLDVISNLTALVDSFIGSGASLASLVTLVLIMGVLSRK